MLTDCTSGFIPLSQVERGRLQGLLQWLGGRSDASITWWWSCWKSAHATCPKKPKELTLVKCILQATKQVKHSLVWHLQYFNIARQLFYSIHIATLLLMITTTSVIWQQAAAPSCYQFIGHMRWACTFASSKYVTIGRPMSPSKVPILVWIYTHIKTRFNGPTWVSPPNSTPSGLHSLVQLFLHNSPMWLTQTHIHTHTCRPHYMWHLKQHNKNKENTRANSKSTDWSHNSTQY